MVEPDSQEATRSNVLERVSDAIVSLNSELEYTFANPQAEQLLDTTDESLRGTYIWDAFPQGRGTVAEQKITEALETGQKQAFQRYNETLDRWFKVRVYPDEDGLTLLFTDISERKEREQELERYEQIIETVPVAVGINTLGEEGKFEFVNQAAVEMFGASSKTELRDYSPSDTYADTDERKEISKQLRETGSLKQYETQLSTLDGETFWGLMTATLTEIEGAEYIIGIIEDITERKQTECELRSKTRAIEAAPIGVSLSDAHQGDNPLTYVNGRFEEVTGYPAEEILGHNCRFLQGKETNDEPVATMRDAIDTGDSVTVELRNYRKDGEQFWNRVSIAPVQTEDELSHFVGFQQDVTEQKRREQELKESKERIAEQNEALVSFTEIVTDTDRTTHQQITDLLELGVRYLSLDVGILSEIIGSDYTVRNVVDPTEAIEPGSVFNLTDTYCSMVYDADGPVAFHNSGDGDIKDHPSYQKHGIESYIGVPVWTGGQRYGTLNFSKPKSREDPFTDTEEAFVRIMAQWIGMELKRQQHQQELEQATQFLRDTEEVGQVGGWEVGLQNERLQWSDELYHIHGLPLDREMAPEEGIKFYHPDDRDTIREAFNRLTTEGEPYDLELRIVTRDDEVRWVHTRGEPRYEDDEIVAVHGTLQDVTERKEREQELKRQNSRLDEFASVISHDLRNPLTVAQGRATILQQRDDDELQEHLSPLVTALERMEQIIEDTLTLARQGETISETSSIPIIDLVGKCWNMVETTEATLEIDDEFTVEGDRSRLQHVFENLFRNAVEHGGNDVTVRVGRTDEDCFYVEDDGPGIPVGDCEAVFEASHTSAAGGTGFGLTIVKRIAEAHGWTVTVTDGQDGGARFEFDMTGLVNK